MAENTEFPKLDLQSSLLDDDKKPFMVDPYKDDYKSQDELKYTPPKIQTNIVDDDSEDYSHFEPEQIDVLNNIVSQKKYNAPDWSVSLDLYEPKDIIEVPVESYKFKTAQNDNEGDKIVIAKFENGEWTEFKDAPTEFKSIFKNSLKKGPNSDKVKFTFGHLNQLLQNADNSIFQGKKDKWWEWVETVIKPTGEDHQSDYPGLYGSMPGVIKKEFSNIEDFYYARINNALPDPTDLFWKKPIPKEIADKIGDVVPPSWIYEQDEDWEKRIKLEAGGVRAFNVSQNRPANTTYADFGDQASLTKFKKLDKKLFGKFDASGSITDIPWGQFLSGFTREHGLDLWSFAITKNLFDKNDYQEWEDLMLTYGMGELGEDRRGRFGEKVFGLKDEYKIPENIPKIGGYKFKPANFLLSVNDASQHLAPYALTAGGIGALYGSMSMPVRSALAMSVTGGLTEVIDPDLRKDFDLTKFSINRAWDLGLGYSFYKLIPGLPKASLKGDKLTFSGQWPTNNIDRVTQSLKRAGKVMGVSATAMTGREFSNNWINSYRKRKENNPNNDEGNFHLSYDDAWKKTLYDNTTPEGLQRIAENSLAFGFVHFLMGGIPRLKTGLEGSPKGNFVHSSPLLKKSMHKVGIIKADKKGNIKSANEKWNPTEKQFSNFIEKDVFPVVEKYFKNKEHITKESVQEAFGDDKLFSKLNSIQKNGPQTYQESELLLDYYYKSPEIEKVIFQSLIEKFDRFEGVEVRVDGKPHIISKDDISGLKKQYENDYSVSKENNTVLGKKMSQEVIDNATHAILRLKNQSDAIAKEKPQAITEQSEVTQYKEKQNIPDIVDNNVVNLDIKVSPKLKNKPKITYGEKDRIETWTETRLKDAGYGYKLNEFELVKKGEEGYVEGEKNYKVLVEAESRKAGEVTLSPSVSIQGYIEDVIIEDSYKRLEKDDAGLKEELDTHLDKILEMDKQIEWGEGGSPIPGNKVELLSSIIVEGDLGYGKTGRDLEIAQLLSLPEGVLNRFYEYTGLERADIEGAFKTDVKTVAPKPGEPKQTEPIVDKEESFKLKPNKEYKGDKVRDKIYSVLPKKDTNANLRKKLNRDPKVGLPKNKSKTLTNEKYRMTIGKKTPAQWLKDVENNMSKKQILEARTWYDNYIADVQPLTDGSPENAMKFVLGSLVTQVNESPQGAINNLLLAYEETTSGARGTAKAGLNDEAVRQIFSKDGNIKGGIGQKLFDFIDSAIGNNTRYLMGNDPKGGSPYTADVHTSRGRGFVDVPFYNALERAFGKNKVKSIIKDFGGNPTETQYENTSFFGNKLTKSLNDMNWMGLNWTTQQVQAVDWVNVISFLESYGIDAGGTMGDAILQNTQSINLALVFGEGTPYSEKFSKIYDLDFNEQLKITEKINKDIIKEASDITGVNVKSTIHQQGFWKDYSSEPTSNITTIASKRGIQSFIDILGYLGQQTEVLGIKNNPTGTNSVIYFYDTNGKFKNLDSQTELYNKLREIAPDNISGATSDYVIVDGKKIPAISTIMDFKPPTKLKVKERRKYLLEKSEEFINLHQESLEGLSDLDIKVDITISDKINSKNNWKENKNGEDYILRLSERYGRKIQERLEDSARRIESKLEKEFKQEEESLKPTFRLKPTEKASDKDLKKSIKEKSLSIEPETRRAYLYRHIVDEFGRLKNIQNQIEKDYGTIPEEIDTYLAQELYIGKAKDKIDNFRDYIYEGGRNNFIRRLNRENIDISEFGAYLYSSHSPERNDYVRKENPEKYEKFLEDPTKGPDDWTASGMTSKDAKKLKKKLEKEYPNIKKFANEFYEKTTKKTLQNLLDGEIISKETFDELSKQFKNYVPLKGGKTFLDNVQGTGKGFSVAQPIKRMKGRKSISNNPFVQTLLDYEQSIIVVEKNKVTKALNELVLEYPSEVWSVSGKQQIPMYNEKGDFVMSFSKKLLDNEIEFFEGGKRRIITIHDKPLSDAMKKLGTGTSIKYLRKHHNFLRAIYTTLSPAFIVRNFVRDIQASFVHMTAEQSAKASKQMIKDTRIALKTIWRVQRGDKPSTFLPGIKKPDKVWAEAYKEYLEAGARVSWLDYDTIEDRLNKLQQEIDRANNAGKPYLAKKSILKLIEDANNSVEQGVRLSAYKTMRDLGNSKAKSASFAKNLTVNFNKKGVWGPTLNSYFLFANPGIQGIARHIDSYREGKGKGKFRNKKSYGMALALMALGYYNSMYNDWVDEEEHDKQSDFDKDLNWLFLIPGVDVAPLKLPMPYVLNVWGATGKIIYDLQNNKIDEPQALSRLMVSLDVGVNPIGGGTPLQTISPTFADPLARYLENRTWTGGYLSPERGFSDYYARKSMNYFDNATETSIGFARLMSEWTGGKGLKKGWVEISPNVLDDLVRTYTGSLGRDFMKTLETGISLYNLEVPDATKLPVVSSLLSKPKPWEARKKIMKIVERSKSEVFGPEINAIVSRQFEIAVKEQVMSKKDTTKKANEIKENQRKLKASFEVDNFSTKIRFIQKTRKTVKNDIAISESDYLKAKEYIRSLYENGYYTRTQRRNVIKDISKATIE